MKEILSRLRKYDLLQVITFNDDIILNEPVENWPRCNCLIAFYSTGFPLKKAMEYAKLRKPFLLNDLTMQNDLMDRYQRVNLYLLQVIFMNINLCSYNSIVI